MNIKSILLGSAAALVAVSGARAADAVVIAEPEPMEYVRVCDTYGAGFYYIPGTETCLSISGLIRYDIDADNFDDWSFTWTDRDWDLGWAAIPDGDDGYDFGWVIVRDPEDDKTYTIKTGDALDDGWAKSAYARVNIDARSETEYGTFRRYIRLSGTSTSGSGDGGVSLEYAYIELGGLLVGYYDTLYDGDFGIWEGDSAGGSTTHQVRYTFNGANGIQAAINAEVISRNVDDYTPNFVANVGVTQGWGSVTAFAAYDSLAEEWAAKAIATFKASDAIELNAMVTYESGSSFYSVSSGWQGKLGSFASPTTWPAFGGGTFTLPAVGIGYEWSFAAAARFNATEKLALTLGGQYFVDAHTGGSDDYRIGGQVDYQVVENMLARLNVNYNGGDSQDYWSGKFRLQSSF